MTKTKLSVTLDADVIIALDVYCTEQRLERSTAINRLVAQGLDVKPAMSADKPASRVESPGELDVDLARKEAQATRARPNPRKGKS